MASLAYIRSTLHLTLELRDEGFLVSNIARVAHGEIPYRDFLEVYGPGVDAVAAPVLRIFGVAILPIRELLAVFRAAAVVFSYLIARHFVPRPFALLGALVAAGYWGRVTWMLNSPYAALFTIPICMLSLLLLLRGQSRNSGSAIVGSGIVCGAALSFKWSLAAMSAYGTLLAICAGAMLRESARASPRGHRVLVLLAWALAGAAIVVPFRSTLTAWDYLLHLAPIHAVLVVVGVRFARFGDAWGTLAHAGPLVLRYCAGFLVVPILVAVLYLWWGSLGDLLYGTFYRPFHYRNYYMPVAVPSRANALLLVCVIAWISAGLTFLRGSRRVAVGFVALGCALAPAGYSAIEEHGNPSLALGHVATQLPAITAFAVAALLATFLSRRRPAESEPAVAALIAALLFQEMMSFQIFPRAGYNVILLLGALAPILAYLSHRWYRVARVGELPATSPRRAAAFLLVALMPGLLVGDIVRETLTAPRPGELAHTALHSPVLAGIRPSPREWRRLKLAAFDELIRELERIRPAQAPIFVIQNEPMITFASGRDPLFPDHALMLFLAGWGLLPENDRDLPDPSAMIWRLRATPEAIVVLRPKDHTTENFKKFFPQVAQVIGEEYRVEKLIGNYKILRRKAAP